MGRAELLASCKLPDRAVPRLGRCPYFTSQSRIQMGVEVSGVCFHLPPLPPPNNTSMASVFSSLSSSTGRGNLGADNAISHHALHRSPFLRSRSLDLMGTRARRNYTLTRAISASFDCLGDDEEEELVSRLHDLANSLQRESAQIIPDSRKQQKIVDKTKDATSFSLSSQPPWPAIRPDAPELPDLVPASVERKANSTDLPLSLRIIKRKKRTPSESQAPSPVSRAFSSLVFIIGELQRCTLQMRGLLFVENLDGILARVQTEMHASFVWLFQQIFSCTPTLMLSLMLLLANFTVSSMGTTTTAFAATVSPPPTTTVFTTASDDMTFDQYPVKTFSVEGGRTASVGGGGGVGGNTRPVAGDTGDGRSGGQIQSPSYHGRAVSSPDRAMKLTEYEEEVSLWNRIVDEATTMQAEGRHEALMDHETLVRFVSPVTVDVEQEDGSVYLQTELDYYQAISQDPSNALLLCNFAQFLYVVLHDHDRAENYFKKAVQTEPADAEALSLYASFLWLARNDITAAEETYLEAIAADPSNSLYAANYAHFLWTTGGEDTCYPLD